MYQNMHTGSGSVLVGLLALSTACVSDEMTTRSSGDHAGMDAALSLGGDAGTLLDAAQAWSSACSWPAQPEDAGPGACRVARATLACVEPMGGRWCLSDNPIRCNSPDDTNWTCHSQCAANEYATHCGGTLGNEVPAADPPPACRQVEYLGRPGIHIYCCPCG